MTKVVANPKQVTSVYSANGFNKIFNHGLANPGVRKRLLKRRLIRRLTNPELSLKRHRQLWDRAELGTSLLTLKKSLPQPEIKVPLEIRFNFRSVLLDLQSFTEKPVFECPFAHPVILFFIISG